MAVSDLLWKPPFSVRVAVVFSGVVVQFKDSLHLVVCLLSAWMLTGARCA
jgi:hypothetical protein